jgi:hypothetical protein
MELTKQYLADGKGFNSRTGRQKLPKSVRLDTKSDTKLGQGLMSGGSALFFQSFKWPRSFSRPIDLPSEEFENFVASSAAPPPSSHPAQTIMGTFDASIRARSTEGLISAR